MLIHKLGEVELRLTELPDGLIIIMRGERKHLSTVMTPNEVSDLVSRLESIRDRICNPIDRRLKENEIRNRK